MYQDTNAPQAKGRLPLKARIESKADYSVWVFIGIIAAVVAMYFLGV